MTLEELNVLITAETKGLRTELNNVKKQLNSVNQTVTKSTAGITAAFKKIGIVLGSAFAVKKMIDFGRASTAAASQLEGALLGLQSILEGQGRSFNLANTFIQEYINDGLVPLTDAVTAYKNLAARGYNDEQIQQVMERLKDSAAFGRQASYTLGQAVSTATEGLKNENSILVDNAGVTKNVAKMWDEYAKSIGKNSQQLTQQEKIQAEVNGIMKETQFQVGDAAKYTNTFAGKLAALNKTFNDIKVNIGNTFIPVLNNVIPALQTISNKLSEVTAKIAQFSQALFGKANVGAQNTDKQAAAISGLGVAAEKTGKQAKKAQDTLAGFDQLNVLNKTEGAEGVEETGAGATASFSLNNGEIGTGVTVSSDIENTINGIKEQFSRIKEYVNTYISEPFNNAMNMISPKIEEFKATLSGAWADIGSLGQPLKNWFANDFTPYLQKVIEAWGVIISGLLDTFNRVFSGIWDTIVHPILENFLTAGLPTITGFATQVVETFTVLFEEVKKIFDMLWREGVKPALDILVGIWTDTTSSIAEAWNTYGNPIFEGIKEVFRNIGEVLWAVWENTIKPVWDTFMQTIDWLWEKHLKPLLDNFLGLVGEFILAGLSIINEFILPLVKEFVEIFGPSIAGVFQTVTSILGTFLATAADIISGVITVIRGIIEFLTGVFTGDWKKAWNGIVNIFRGIFQGIGGIIKGVVNTAIDMINGMIRAITNGLNFVIKAINKISWDVPDWVPGIGGKSWGFHIDTLSSYTIPKLAHGGITNGPMHAIVGDNPGGREVISPLDDLKDIIVSAVVSAMQQPGSSTGGGESGDLVLKFGETEFGRIAIKAINDAQRQAGRTLLIV